MRPFALAFAAICLHAQAFDVDGFKSGMTLAQVASELKHYQLKVIKEELNWGAYVAVPLNEKGDVDLTRPGFPVFNFCKGRLFLYSRPIDFDADYIAVLEERLRTFGSPQKVLTERQPWEGPGGGYVATARMRWYEGEQRIDLTFSPEGRTGTGALRHFRNAAIEYAQKNSCWDLKNW